MHYSASRGKKPKREWQLDSEGNLCFDFDYKYKIALFFVIDKHIKVPLQALWSSLAAGHLKLADPRRQPI